MVSRPPTTAYETSTRRGSDWRDDAACQQYDPELWFPIGTTGPALVQVEEARAICLTKCSDETRAACLAFAVDPVTRQDEGIWGATTEDERRKAKRKREREALSSRSREVGS